MKTITIEVPDNLSGAVAESEDDLPRALRLAAAIQRYSQGLISEGKGAELAGLTRSGYLQSLSDAKVDALQVTSEDLKAELARTRVARWQRVSARAGYSVSLWIKLENDAR
jgi:predicted HTH domain antitoxin